MCRRLTLSSLLLSCIAPRILQPTQNCCRCLHSRRSRTVGSDPTKLSTNSVLRSRNTDLFPSPAANRRLQCKNNNNNSNIKSPYDKSVQTNKRNKRMSNNAYRTAIKSLSSSPRPFGSLPQLMGVLIFVS